MTTWTKVPGPTEEGVLTDERGRQTHRVQFRHFAGTDVYNCYRRDSRGWSLFDVIRVEDGDREAAKNRAKWICGEDQL